MSTFITVCSYGLDLSFLFLKNDQKTQKETMKLFSKAFMRIQPGCHYDAGHFTQSETFPKLNKEKKYHSTSPRVFMELWNLHHMAFSDGKGD